MKVLKSLFVTLLCCGFLVSCEKEENLNAADADNIPGLGGDTWAQTSVDKWIYDNLTVPFNISVKYKWDQSELEFDKTLVPPKEEQVIPVMDAISRGWINPYISVGGELFFKKYTPKFFNLVGSGSYNLDGSVTLGTAEGGRKVILYQTNYIRTKGMPGYVRSDSNLVKEMFSTIHHEFGHILHQNILYPPEFKAIGQSLYTSDWINYSLAEANQNGFVSRYSMSGPDDDFVEMISFMLVEGRAGFDNLVNSIPPGTSTLGTTQAEAIKSLRDKESIVVNYYKQVYNIDFYTLQTKTRAAVVALIY